MIDRFLRFSAEVAAFSEFELYGTGQAEAYYDAVIGVVGVGFLGELLDAYDRIADRDRATRDARLRREVFGDPKIGPIARHIIKLWYIGIWYELPHEWTEAYGAIEANVEFTVSGAAYIEGLLWPAIGSHPSGAKAPGYGSWAEPPVIPQV